EVQELLRRDVAVVRLAQDLAGVVEGDDNNQVEEQLEPGRAPVRVEISQVLHAAMVGFRARPCDNRCRTTRQCTGPCRTSTSSVESRYSFSWSSALQPSANPNVIRSRSGFGRF